MCSARMGGVAVTKFIVVSNLCMSVCVFVQFFVCFVFTCVRQYVGCNDHMKCSGQVPKAWRCAKFIAD